MKFKFRNELLILLSIFLLFGFFALPAEAGLMDFFREMFSVQTPTGYSTVTLASDTCNNGVGWSEPSSAARKCGWPPGAKGYIKDCCCCYIRSHVHDLGSTFSNKDIKINYRPSYGSGKMYVDYSTDGTTWDHLMDISVPYSKAWYSKTVNIPGSFRYVKVGFTSRYIDSSNVEVLDTSPIQTHNICSNGQCMTINGTGTNQCSVDSQCRHTECSGNQCITINNPGTNECSTDSDCITSEICNNNKDDDGDGLIDCLDSDCSHSLYCQPTSCDCPDLNNDGITNIFDMNIISTYWGTSNSLADLNNDGIVDAKDINCVTEYFNRSTDSIDSCNNQQWCNDSDGGINYYLRGTLTSSNIEVPKIDYCSFNEQYNKYLLNEYYCVDNQGTIRYGIECPEGYTCQNGACIQENTTNCPQYYTCPGGTQVPWCYSNTPLRVALQFGETRKITIGDLEDSITLSGINSNGNTATITINGKTDTIDEGATKIIGGVNVYAKTINYYGLDEYPGDIQLDIISNVNNDTCVCLFSPETQCPIPINTTTCIDTDGGINYNIAGKVIYNNSIMFDYCNNNILSEQYCENGEHKSKTYTCPYGCVGAQCLERNQISKLFNISKNQIQSIDFYGKRYTINASSCTAITPPTMNIQYGNTTIYFNNDFYEEKELGDGNKLILVSCPGFENSFYIYIIGDNHSVENTTCNGCYYDGKCYNYEHRKIIDGVRSYCNYDGSFVAQKEENEQCMNNYECKGNFCVDGKCIEAGTLERIIAWFKQFFNF